MVLSRKSRKTRRVSRYRRGGASAAENMLAVVGDGMTQATNSLSVLPGMNQGTIRSLTSVPIDNININNPMSQVPTRDQVLLVQSAGRRRRKGRKGKRGGSFGSIIGQAVVPFSLLAAQQYYGTRSRKRGKKASRKSKKASRRR